MVRQERLDRSPVRARPRRDSARRIPFLVGPDDMQRLRDLVDTMVDNPLAPLRAATYKAIFILLYGLGLRVGEVSRLQLADVDFGRRLLVIRNTKFGKTRLVPFGPRIGDMLHEYRKHRGENPAPDTAFFSFTRRGPVHPGTISQTFHHLVPRLCLVIPPGVASPRVHDLRHAFAVGTLLRWYREGVEPPQSRAHAQPALGPVAHFLRVPRSTRARDARRCRARRSDPAQARRSTGDALPGARRDHNVVRATTIIRMQRRTRSGAHPVPLQHGGARAGSCRPARSRSRPRSHRTRTPSRQGRQMENVPALDRNRAADRHAARPRPAPTRSIRLLDEAWSPPDALRHLQTRAPSHTAPRSPSRPSRAARISAHDGRTPARGRRRSQRD